MQVWRLVTWRNHQNIRKRAKSVCHIMIIYMSRHCDLSSIRKFLNVCMESLEGTYKNKTSRRSELFATTSWRILSNLINSIIRSEFKLCCRELRLLTIKKLPRNPKKVKRLDWIIRRDPMMGSDKSLCLLDFYISNLVYSMFIFFIYLVMG